MPPAHNRPELVEQPREVAVRADRYELDSDPGSVAAILREHRHEILARWLEITVQQPFHAGRSGSARAGQILPLFDAVVNVLQSAVPRSVEAEAVIDTAVLDVAQRHARTRFEQGLQAADVMTEFRLLRQEIGRALRDIQQPITGLKGRLQLVLRRLTGPDPEPEHVTRMIHQ